LPALFLLACPPVTDVAPSAAAAIAPRQAAAALPARPCAAFRIHPRARRVLALTAPGPRAKAIFTKRSERKDTMAEFSKPLAIALMLALTGTAQAQDAGAPAEDQATADAETAAPEAAPSSAPAPETAADAAPAEADPNAPGTPYVAETKGDWQVQCVRTADGNDPCQLYQLLNDEAGNSVAEISLFNLPGGQQAAAGATIVTPLETLLTRNITMRVDNSEPKVYPFTF